MVWWLFHESHFTSYLHTWKLRKPCMTFLSILSPSLSHRPNQTVQSVYIIITFLTYPPKTWDVWIWTNMGCRETLTCWKHIILGIALGLFNFISTLVNIYYLYNEDHILFASLSLFLLWFPGNTIFAGENIWLLCWHLSSGLVTSVTFVVLYSRGDSNVVKLKKKNLIIYPLCLLFFYPLVPIALTIAYLVTKKEKHHERATISKFFAGFLDHGPQFVLRLVVVVLIGLSQGGVYQRWNSV